MRKITSIILAVLLAVGAFFMVGGCAGQNKIKVTFDLDGGTLVTGELVQEVTKADEIKIPEIVKEGYTFVGWDTTISTIKEDATIKALWEKNKFTVRFSVANGGTFDESGGALIQTVIKGEDLIYPIFTREGYTLTWDRELSSIQEACTVNGVWTANKYKIRFVDENGQTIDGVDDMEIGYGEQVTELPSLSSDSKKFVGWKQSSGGTFSVGQIYKFNSDITLKAVWTEFEKYVITVNLAGGDQMQYPTVYSENAASPTIINAANKTGYTFKGWVETDKDGAPIADAKLIVQIPVGAKGDKYFIATWEVKTYTVIFKTVSGTLDKESMTFTYGQTIENLPIISGNEGEFICWKYGDNEIKEGDVWTFDVDGVEVKAEFIRKFVFTLNLQGVCGNTIVPCTLPDGVDTTITIDEFKSIQLPKATPTLKDDYRFSNWRYKDDSGKYVKLLDGTEISQNTLKGLDFGDKMTINIELVAYCSSNWTGYY